MTLDMMLSIGHRWRFFFPRIFYSNLLRIYSSPQNPLWTRKEALPIEGWLLTSFPLSSFIVTLQSVTRFRDFSQAKISAVGGDYALCWCAKGATCSEVGDCRVLQWEDRRVMTLQSGREVFDSQNLQFKNLKIFSLIARCLGNFMFHQIWNQAMYTSNAVRDLANVY